MPGRDRLPATPAVRHRAGRAAARLSESGARHAGRGGPRVPPGEGPLGGRLVGPAAARGTAPLCRTRRRGADRASRRARRRTRGGGQDGWAGRSSRPCWRPSRPAHGPIRGGVPWAFTASSPAVGWPWCASSGRPGTGSPRRRTCHRGACCPMRRSSRRPGRSPPTTRSWCGSAGFPAATPGGTRESGWPRSSGRGPTPTTSCPRRAAGSCLTGRRPPIAGRNVTPPPRPGWRPPARW